MTTRLSPGDVEQLYRNSIVEYNVRLAAVRDIIYQDGDDSCKLAIRYLGETKNILIDPDPDEIHCPTEPYRLGYFQDGEVAHYLSRAPRRQYRVGWSEENVNNLSVTAVVRNGAKFLENLSGKYMTFKEALAKSVETSGRYAFDRQFAISEGGTILYYKGQGICRIKDGVPDLKAHGVQHLQCILDMALEKQ